MKKKLTILTTLIVTVMLLVACGSKPDDSNNEGSTEQKLTGSLEEIMTNVETELEAEIMTIHDSVDLKDKDSVKYNLGLNDAQGIEEALASNAMISTHAYSTVLVRVEQGADVQKIAKEMVAGVDLMKWICVGADDAQAAIYGDLIYLVMLDSSLEDKSIQDHFDAFETVASSHVDTIVKR